MMNLLAFLSVIAIVSCFGFLFGCQSWLGFLRLVQLTVRRVTQGLRLHFKLHLQNINFLERFFKTLLTNTLKDLSDFKKIYQIESMFFSYCINVYIMLKIAS